MARAYSHAVSAYRRLRDESSSLWRRECVSRRGINPECMQRRLLAKNIVEDYTCLPGNYGKDAEAYEIMAQLAAKRLLYWGFVIPLGPIRNLHCERHDALAKNP